MGNIVKAKLRDNTQTIIAGTLYQYDYGQILKIDGLELPDAYEVHFANRLFGEDATTQIGNAEGVSIPDIYLTTGKPVYAWLYLHEGEDDGETVRAFEIPVRKRARPTNAAPTPVEQDVITQTIAAINVALAKSETNVSHYPTITDGEWYVWDAEQNAFVSTGVHAQGEKGDTGKGITMIRMNPDYTLSIYYSDGTVFTTESIRGEKGDRGDPFKIRKTFASVDDMMEYTGSDVTEGDFVVIASNVEDPDNAKLYVKTASSYQFITDLSGAQGIKGDDGFSPTVSVSKSGRQTTIIITDKKGTAVAEIFDGENANVLDDNAGAGVTNKTWSADKLTNDFSGKADKTDTVLNTTLSRGRRANTSVGNSSIAFGNIVEASGNYSFATGNHTVASGTYARAEGSSTVASGPYSHADGSGTKADGNMSHASGMNTVANGAFSKVHGTYNVPDDYASWPEWTANTLYVVGAKVKIPVQVDGEIVYRGYICNTQNSDSEFNFNKWNRDTKMNYVSIVGNGTSGTNKSNAYSLDWDGNGHFKGDVYVGCNPDGTGGTKLEAGSQIEFATDAEIQAIIDAWEVRA